MLRVLLMSTYKSIWCFALQKKKETKICLSEKKKEKFFYLHLQKL